jgi:hypothetical protein
MQSVTLLELAEIVRATVLIMGQLHSLEREKVSEEHKDGDFPALDKAPISWTPTR